MPLTAKGGLRYLQPEFFSSGKAEAQPSFKKVWNHPDAITLHLGMRIIPGGYAAYRNLSFAIENREGSIQLVNWRAELGESVVLVKN